MTSQAVNQVRLLREQQGWTQAQLADRARVSRTAISAIEQHRMSPSVDAAIRIAGALGRTVEAVFAAPTPASRDADRWAWAPAAPCPRYWQAQIGNRRINYPVELTAQGLIPHDGGAAIAPADTPGPWHPIAQSTLVIACCDPAISLLLTVYARRSGYRPICFHRTSREALDLLRRGVVHLAGVHLERADSPGGNAAAAKAALGAGHRLLRVARWEAGIAVARAGKWTARSLARSGLRWIGRAAGSGARDCQDEVLGARPAPKRIAGSHHAVAEALRWGWADAGACLRLVCEETGLNFVPVRQECFDLCLRDTDLPDPRVAALIDAVRSRPWRELIRDLPGYQLSPDAGELQAVS